MKKVEGKSFLKSIVMRALAYAIIITISCAFIAGCSKGEESKDNKEQINISSNETTEAILEEPAKEEVTKEEVSTDKFQNTIPDETKNHAKNFSSIDEQYTNWRGTHVNNKFEYSWVTTEPYTSQMDEYVKLYDNVDWNLVEASTKFDETVFNAVALAGYNFVRIPLDTRFFFTDDCYFNIDSTGQIFKGNIETYNESNWQDLDRAIAWCIDRNLHVCIDVHSTPGGYMIGGDEEESRQGLFSKDNSSDSELFLKFWKQAAERYKDIDSKALSFNLYNEPPNFMHERQDDYIELMVKAIDEIRTISPDRLIFVDTLDYSTAGFDNMEKFSGIDNLIFSFHYYSEYQWSTEEMQSGDWKSECSERLSCYNEWAKDNGVKWMLQEYGIQSDIHDLDTRLEFVKYVVEQVNTYNVPYCHYGFATGFPFNLYDGSGVTDPDIVTVTSKK